MQLERDVLTSLAAGVVGSLAAVGYWSSIVPVDVPAVPGAPVELVVGVAVVVVPFAAAAGAAYLALSRRIVVPMALVAGIAVAPIVFGLSFQGTLDVAIVVGPLAVVVAILEAIVRSRSGRGAEALTAAELQALSVGIAAAALYVGAFGVRAALPLWRAGGVPATAGSPALEVVMLLWYVLGVSLVLVGLPVALNRRFGVVTPLVGLVAYLLVDLAYLQPAIAGAPDWTGVLFAAVWPTLAAVLVGLGAVELWIRRRGRADEEEDGGGGRADEDGDEESGFSLEGGLFGDRV